MEPIALECLVTRFGILINLESLKQILLERGYASLLTSLSVSSTKRVGKKIYVKTMKLYKFILSPSGQQFISVPRFAGIKSKILDILRHQDKSINIKYSNKITSGKSIQDKFSDDSNSVDLEEHQEICLNYLLKNVYNQKRAVSGFASCIFIMDTGLGKTFTAAALIEKLQEKTLVIIPNTSNLTGWYDPFKIYLKNLKLGEYHSDCKVDGDVVIMTIDSALGDSFTFGKNKKKIPYYNYFKEFGLVIYDEIHDYPTAVRQEIFWRTNFKYGLGLTATHNERLDGMDLVYYKHVGRLINAKEIPGFLDFAEELKWDGNVEVIDYYGPPEFTEKITSVINTVNVSEMHKQFSRDVYRNKMIIDKIKEKYHIGRYTFVFAVHRAPLEDLYSKLIEEGIDVCAPELENNSIEPEKTKSIDLNHVLDDLNELDDFNELTDFKKLNKFVKEPINEVIDRSDDSARSANVTTFMGGSDDTSKEIAYKSARIILVTYSFGKQSISIKRMDTIIFIQPMRNKMRQTIGRILRRGGDTAIPREIVDIRDMNTSLKSQFDTRSKIYREKEFTIKHTVVKWQDVKI